jgi:hypothetical protein
MADVQPGQLGPNELDLLEDALEELEDDAALERWSEDELGPQLRERLSDYRSILVATRQAFPLEDVPAGVLDGVLAQARQAAAAAPVAGMASEPWWIRLRRSFMVPALALAGTAVLVLWMVDPEDPSKLVGSPPSDPARAASPVPEAAARLESSKREQTEATATAPLAAPADAKAAAGNEDDADAGAYKDQAVTLEAEAKDAGEKLQERKPSDPAKNADEPGLMGSLGDVPGGVQGGAAGRASSETKKETGGSAGPASGRWDIVSRGDRARQAGDCVAARDEYALALEDDEARVRARAFAGLGLCDAVAGDEASADANYDRARALDDAIGGFIESQNDRSRGAAKKAKPAKKSKNAVDAFDPFG